MLRYRDRGAAAVEFALLVPLLVLMMVAIVDYGLWYSDGIGLKNAARQGARMAAVGTSDSACTFSSPARNAACTANQQAGLIGGAIKSKAFVVGGGPWSEGKQLQVCSAIKEGGISGLAPLPADGILRAKVVMRIEQDQSGGSFHQDSGPPGGSWSWCA